MNAFDTKQTRIYLGEEWGGLFGEYGNVNPCYDMFCKSYVANKIDKKIRKKKKKRKENDLWPI